MLALIIAFTCILYNSGNKIPNLTPLFPNMGLISAICLHLSETCKNVILSSSAKISNSFILSAKSSYLDKTSKYFYQYIDTDGLPYSFSDVYGKFSFFSKNGSKFNVHGFNFNDAVDYTDLTSLGWKNYGFGSNLVLVPSSAKMLVGTQHTSGKI